MNRLVNMTVLSVLTVTSGAAFAGPTFYATNASGTTSVLHGGNRELTRMAFTGASNSFGGAEFLSFTDGRLTNNVGSYGWNDAIGRDVNGNNNHSGNPDRADTATAFLGEAGKTGTLREVFGEFNGYKNMSYIIDGEDNGAWTLDLLFGGNRLFSADADHRTVDLAIVERGGNSDLRIRGIRQDGSVTDAIMMMRAQTGRAGWTLDTLEIGGAQNVVGVGISLDATWANLKGFRFEAANGMNGPDLVAVGVGANNIVPTPGSIALLAAAGLIAGKRRRK
ncbi:MAG: exosortase-dependent surface protein XDP2 [Planctomycetota bacterium]|nr:exosortase-dependent surface protein XDP2 [Planctomycetota bacterium]